jgi:general secretion pathway protein D
MATTMNNWLSGMLSTSGWSTRRRTLGTLALGLVFTVAAGAAPVTLNLKDADINALVESMSVLTKKNFIVDPRVKGRVTIVSSKPMDEKELYEVFLAVLGVHGFAAVPSGEVIKIVPAAGAKQESIPTVDRQRGVEPDQIVTRIIQVQNVSAAQIVPILRPLIPPQGHLAAYTPTNVLIISDSAANVERVAAIIARIDLASNEEVEIVPLRHASSTEVVRVLTALEQTKSKNDPAAGVGTPTRMVADERSNSILLSGDKASRLRLRALISHLDTPMDSGGNTQVVYLRYAKAKELVNVLQGVSKNLSNEAARNAPMPGQGQAPPGGGGSSGSAGLVDIQADEATNSLVITAPPELIRSLRTVIAQLDVRRAQVLVEAVIAEISAEKTAELGVQWGVNGNNAIGFTNFDAGTSSLSSVLGVAGAIDFALNPPGDTAPSLPKVTEDQIPRGLQLGVGGGDFAVLISALAKDADTNVLSTPTIVTLDNEEAEIVVGQNVPFVTGTYTTSTTGTSNGNGSSLQSGGPFQTIQRQDVGITLKVKPQINEGNAVKLEIAQEVSNVVPSANAATQGPTTNKRSIKTKVLVENGQILVLGGLIDESLNESAQKVPVLGDVPVLGNLFRYRDTSRLKRNLMVFLHPVILRDPVQSTLYTSDKYSYIRDQQLAAREKGNDYLLSQVQSPVLKPQDDVKRQGTILNVSPPTPPMPPAPPQSAAAGNGATAAPSPATDPADFGFGNK